MKLRVDLELDNVRILLTDRPIEESEEVAGPVNLIIDYDADQKLVGFEILNAREALGDELDNLARIATENEEPKFWKLHPVGTDETFIGTEESRKEPARA